MPLVLHRGNDRRAEEAGFTLLELGVVVVMMSVLAAVLLPALASAKEKSKRAVCQSNVRQILYVLDMYTTENEEWLPSAMDNIGYYHSIRMSDQTFTNLVGLAGGSSNIFYCPNVVSGGAASAIGTHDSLGYVIGYNYLANAIQTTQKGNDYWIPARKMTDSASSELIADPNFWVMSNSKDPALTPGLKIAPHGAAGAAIVRRSGPTAGSSQPVDSAGIGAAGGNIGYLDYSVRWRNMKQMQTWAASPSLDSFGNW